MSGAYGDQQLRDVVNELGGSTVTRLTASAARTDQAADSGVVFLCSGGITPVLPAPVEGEDAEYIFVNRTGEALTIACNGSDTIAGLGFTPLDTATQTAANAQPGDYIILRQCGTVATPPEWIVTRARGIWTLTD